jgi:putative ubiquitin-RnfH superfamily antitoxin RatB of RatAB toxin-antitoxin module
MVSKITVEVAYATPVTQKIISLEVDADFSIETIIDKSGILEIFPEIDLTKQKVGVFSKTKKLTDKIKDGDRIEIYRALTIDPKEARRKRAKENPLPRPNKKAR